MAQTLPVGKLPVELLAKLVAHSPISDPRVIVGPGVGLDCAVIEMGDKLLALKSDPITFAAESIGWYAVHINANDIAATGADPRWMLATLLLPEKRTTPELVEQITVQIHDACREIGAVVVGGHTEITFNLDRPVVVGTMIGEVERERLVTPRGLNPGDRILLTKGVPIEATAILAREFPERVSAALSEGEIEQARGFLRDPGLSVLRDARIAMQAGRVTAMHDPTEGGLAGALWELAEASGRALSVDVSAVPIPALSARLCRAFGMDPLATIASGALLIAAPAGDAPRIRHALESEGIACAEIGRAEDGPPAVWRTKDGAREKLPRPERDDIARAYES